MDFPTSPGKLLAIRPRQIDIEKKLPVVFEESNNVYEEFEPRLGRASSIDINYLAEEEVVSFETHVNEAIPIPNVRVVNELEVKKPFGRTTAYLKYQERTYEDPFGDVIEYEMDDDDFDFLEYLEKQERAKQQESNKSDNTKKTSPKSKAKTKGKAVTATSTTATTPPGSGITEDLFEKVMDMLEKESFQQRPRVMTPAAPPVPEKPRRGRKPKKPVSPPRVSPSPS
eukprot:TRINITY_DN4079_c0_g2_i1.p1 TRINITY_DN4079_c0_g2~~TRINITY_DN4079_c0_g2_i1.p1  ORF type:complete len:227 (+),score=68.47 TRINITY_DN4079_c0_g2_i1:261-941(+)